MGTCVQYYSGARLELNIYENVRVHTHTHTHTQTSSPPESPDETKVKRKPLAPSFDLLPNQTNLPGAAGTTVTKGLMTGGVAGVTGLNQSQSSHLRVTRSPSPSSVAKGGQVPPSPPYNSGSLSSSGDLLSAGDGLVC